MGGHTPSEAVVGNVTATDDGISFEPLPGLPIGVRLHCAVILDESSFFVAGGMTDNLAQMMQGRTFLYHKKDK